MGLAMGGCATTQTKHDGKATCRSTTGSKAIDRADMDLSVRPGDDFFRYVNGAWLDRTEIPDDKVSYTTFDIVRDRRDDMVRSLLKEVAALKTKQPGTAEQKVGDFYSVGMSEKLAEKNGTAPLKPWFEKIHKAASIQDIQDIIAFMHTHSMETLFVSTVMQDLKDSQQFSFYFWQTGLGLPDRDYYVKTDARSIEIRERYIEYVAKMLALLGEDAKQSKAGAERIMAMETRLAQQSMTNLERRNFPALYNKLTIDQLSSLSPDFSWERYFANIGDIKFHDVIVTEPKVVQEISRLMQDVSVNDWKTYLRFGLINETAPYLNAAFVKEHYRFYSEFLSGSKKMLPRWQRVVMTTNELLGELIGKLYVKKHFPPQAKQRMVEMTKNIKKSMRNRIRNLEWMQPETKNRALEKLSAIRLMVGYPDKWEDYSKLQVQPDSYVSNVMRAGRFHYYKQMEKYGKPVDPEEWVMSPQTVNAGYHPLKNTITFPAGILQPPFFYIDGDDAVNYGAIGMAIAHELTHGFDDQGRRFDKDGNMTDWWSKQDEDEFVKRTQFLVDQYDAFVAVDDIHVNGKLSLGENIADFGGLSIAYSAYLGALGSKTPPRLDGFTHNQRFFLSFGKVFRGKIRDKALKRKVQEDVHPWGRFRANGAPFNMPEFYEVFGIQSTDMLYRNAELRPVIW